MNKKVTETTTTKEAEEDQSLNENTSSIFYEIKKAFNFFDKDKTGTIDVQEFKGALNKLGIDDNGTINQLFDKFDVNKSGKVSYDEFINLYKNLERVLIYINKNKSLKKIAEKIKLLSNISNNRNYNNSLFGYFYKWKTNLLKYKGDKTHKDPKIRLKTKIYYDKNYKEGIKQEDNLIDSLIRCAFIPFIEENKLEILEQRSKTFNIEFGNMEDNQNDNDRLHKKVNTSKSSKREIPLEIICCGICLDDAHIINNKGPSVKYPGIKGHEIIGKVKKLGPLKKNIKEGAIVGVRLPSGVTFDDGFSEYITVPENLITIIPNGINPIDATPFLCAGVTCYDALKNSKAVKGDLVGIVGIGGLGHLAIQFANKMGFKVVGISKSEDKKEIALKLGCDSFINYNKEEVGKELIKLGGAKVILVTVPDEKIINKLIEGLAFEGRIIIVSGFLNKVEVDTNEMLVKRKYIYGWSSTNVKSIKECLEFAIKENIKPIVEVFKFNDLALGYEKMIKDEARFRIVINFENNK